MFAHSYGFTKHDVLDLTRKQIVFHLEHIRKQNHADKAFEAKLHGFKMSAPVVEQQWSAEENERLAAVAAKRFEEMSKNRHAELKGAT